MEAEPDTRHVFSLRVDGEMVETGDRTSPPADGTKRDSIDQVLPAVYDELRALAERSLRHERGDHTLQATALVHEAYLRLAKRSDVPWEDRAHFSALAAQAIRRILVDHARHRRRAKRGGQRNKLPLDAVVTVAPEPGVNLVELDEALTRFSEQEPRKAQVVEMRFFGGMTADETAEVLGVSTRSVERDWRFARVWLFRELSSDESDINPGGGR